MYTIHTLHTIPVINYSSSTHICNKSMPYITLASGINQYNHDFLKGLLFIKDNNELTIFSTLNNGIIGKYNMDNEFTLFVHNNIMYHKTAKYIRSIYPEMKIIIENTSPIDICYYANKYFLVNYNPTSSSYKLVIYDNNFNLYYSFVTSNTEYYLKCLCNEKIMVIRQGAICHYFDIENRVIIDCGNFNQWLKLNDKMVLVEHNTGNLMIKRICDYREKITDNDCIICFNEIKNKVALIPCGHTKFCEKCINDIKDVKDKQCPICRVKYTSILKIFN